MKNLFLIFIIATATTASSQWCNEIAINFTYSSSGTTVYFTDQSSASNGWGIEKRYWDYGDSIVDSMILNPVHVYTEPGFYNVCVTVHGVLPGDSATELHCISTKCNQVHALGTGISDIGENQWQVYPNPSPGYFKIKNNGYKVQSVSVYNSMGQMLVHTKTTDEWIHLPADISSISCFVKLEFEEGNFIKHLLIGP